MGRGVDRPLRIAFLVSQFPELSETFILNQVTGLLDAGHEVEMVSCRPERPEVTHGVVGAYRLLERTYFNVAPVRPKWWSYLKTLGMMRCRGRWSREGWNQ